MGALSAVLRDAEGGRLSFWCPGCNTGHMIAHGEGPGPRWGWNGSVDKPTFTPSVLVSYNGPDAGVDGAPPRVCHSFVTDGRIQFLGDCTHALAGQTVDLPPHWANQLPQVTDRSTSWPIDHNAKPASPIQLSNKLN